MSAQQADKFFTPFRELNTLAIENVEKLADIQTKFIEDSTRTAIESFKGAAAVSDVESLQTYLSNQAEASKKLTERTLADSKSVMELGNRYASEAQKIVKDTLKQTG